MTDPRPFLVGGEWRSSDDILEVRFPYTNEVVGRVCQATEQDLADAIRAAERGFDITRKLPAHARSRILYALLDRMQARRSELVETLILEGGKTRGVAEGETTRAMETVRVAAEEAKRVTGGSSPSMDRGRREPRGLRPAPAAGPGAGHRALQLPAESGVPQAGPGHRGGQLVHPQARVGHAAVGLAAGGDDARSRVPARGAELSRLSREHGRAAVPRRIKYFTFTGSSKVGWYQERGRAQARRAGAGRQRQPSSTRTPTSTTPWADRVGGFTNAGQNCISVQRADPPPGVRADGRQAAGPHRAIEGRRPREAATDVGPMIPRGSERRHGNRRQRSRVARS